MNFENLVFCLHKYVPSSNTHFKNLFYKTLESGCSGLTSKSDRAETMPYIELDFKLQPRKIMCINDTRALKDHKKPPPSQDPLFNILNQVTSNFEVKKFPIENKSIWSLLEKVIGTRDKMPSLKPVLGPNTKVCYDKDWGIFSTVLACYNNHWTLKIGPEDMWNVVTQTLVYAVNDHANEDEVRRKFVDHEGQKRLDISVGPTLENLKCEFLINEFSSAIKKNLKTVEFAKLMQADFSTTSTDKYLISQIMLMSSVKKYFSYECSTSCGIPGVIMKGEVDDWKRLSTKFDDLENSISSIIPNLGLEKWFKLTKTIFKNLCDTYMEHPNKDWWSRILSWNVSFGSGERDHWSGWMADFMGCTEDPDKLPSGLVTVPVHFTDTMNHPPIVDDVGLLVAGTLGFIVEDHDIVGPIVEPHTTWNLLLPPNSPVFNRLTSIA